MNKNEFGDVVSIYNPSVQVTMNESEEGKFHKMMDWIEHQYCNYNYEIFHDFDILTAYVEVSDGQDGAEFLQYYKEEKKAVK